MTSNRVPQAYRPRGGFPPGRHAYTDAMTSSARPAPSTRLWHGFAPMGKVDGNEFVVARGVEAFQVKFEPVPGQRTISLMRATVSLTIRTDSTQLAVGSNASQTVTMSTSVMPRRNVW